MGGLQLYNKMLKENLSVRAIENEVKAIKQAGIVPRKTISKTPISFRSYEQNFSQLFETPIKLVANDKGKGTLTINFKSEADLKRILSKFTKIKKIWAKLKYKVLLKI